MYGRHMAPTTTLLARIRAILLDHSFDIDLASVFRSVPFKFAPYMFP